MPHRFYLPNLTDSGTVVLDGLEAHHLINVLRCKPGEVVELFDGRGLVASAEIIGSTRKSVELRILSAESIEPSTRQVVLGTAVPKGDRFDWLIEKATELGVTRLIPLVTARSVVDPRESKLDKLRQTVIAACKQSGRNHLMDVSPVTTWQNFVAQEITGNAALVAHPGSGSLPLNSVQLDGQSTIVFAVGPEGGFTDEEVNSAITNGARTVSLGPHILRIETAALALAARAISE